jgi:hypothetical protein
MRKKRRLPLNSDDSFYSNSPPHIGHFAGNSFVISVSVIRHIMKRYIEFSAALVAAFDGLIPRTGSCEEISHYPHSLFTDN